MSDDEHVYVRHDAAGFDQAPPDQAAKPLEANRHYEAHMSARHVQGDTSAKLWVIEYDSRKRLKDSTLVLKEGLNRMEFRSSAGTTCFRAAIRFCGSGTVSLSPLAMFCFDECEDSPNMPGQMRPHAFDADAMTRSAGGDEFHTCTGENLVFIVGAPRSGTTWVLNLLRQHPDVVLANADNLDVRINNSVTMETNVFNSTRPFLDGQIKYNFFQLSMQYPGKVIVEKTPIHLFFVDRIRRVFPKAALVLAMRDGRDVVTSLLHVGRDTDSWWKNAPDTVEKAALLWDGYAKAADDCITRFKPYIVAYESLLERPEQELVRLLLALGLSDDHVEEYVQACRNGKGIDIPGVFREGQTGGWKKEFSSSDVKRFKRIAGDMLIRLGYETDNRWNC